MKITSCKKGSLAIIISSWLAFWIGNQQSQRVADILLQRQGIYEVFNVYRVSFFSTDNNSFFDGLCLFYNLSTFTFYVKPIVQISMRVDKHFYCMPYCRREVYALIISFRRPVQHCICNIAEKSKILRDRENFYCNCAVEVAAAYSIVWQSGVRYCSIHTFLQSCTIGGRSFFILQSCCYHKNSKIANQILEKY